MNPLKPLSSLICLMFLSACSTSTPATSQQQSFSIAQINQPTASIRCQDIQNPAYQQAILNAINEIRQHPQQCGGQYFPAVAPLKWSHALSQSAFAHAQDMAQHSMLGHTSSTGHDFRSRLKTQFKGHGGGENVARGQNSLNEVMATWLASPVHCRNLMHPKFTDYAIACTVDQSAKQKTYWTQQFGVR